MTDIYAAACRRARKHAREQIKKGVPSIAISDAMVTEALALWAAESGRLTAAKELLRVWTEVRDGA